MQMNGTRKWGRAMFAALTLLAAGCAARNDYSAVERAHPHAINADAGSIALRHIHLDAPDGTAHPRGATIALRLTIINTGQTHDALTHVSSPLAGQLIRQDPTGVRTDQPLGLPVDQAVRMPPTQPGRYKRSAPMYSQEPLCRSPSTSPTRAASPCQYPSPARERFDPLRCS
jgi:hypothetical protein